MKTKITQGFFFFQVENLESKLLGILLNIDKKLNNTEVSVDEKEKVKLFSSYHPPTKLREGNVFTPVCLFTGGGSTFEREGLVLTSGGVYRSGGTHPTGIHSCLLLLLTEMYRILIQYIFSRVIYSLRDIIFFRHTRL